MSKAILLEDFKDNYCVSTIKVGFMSYYGTYETGIMYLGLNEWKIVKAYETEEDAIKGHEYFMSLSEEELGRLEQIKELEE